MYKEISNVPLHGQRAKFKQEHHIQWPRSGMQDKWYLPNSQEGEVQSVKLSQGCNQVAEGGEDLGPPCLAQFLFWDLDDAQRQCSGC